MSRFPWMPFYWPDYLADTLHLSTEEHGAYILLIGAYWMRGEPLPDDDRYLCSVVKSNRQRWAQLKKTVGALFEIRGGAWHHKRIDYELLRASERHNSAIANGRAGGLAKSKLTTTTTTTTKKKEEESKKVEDRAPEKARVPKRVRVQLPSNPVLSEEMASEAQSYWASHGRTDLASGEQFAQFCDHHRSRGSAMADWAAAWRTWYRNALKFNSPGGRNNGKEDKSHSAFIRGAARSAGIEVGDPTDLAAGVGGNAGPTFARLSRA